MSHMLMVVVLALFGFIVFTWPSAKRKFAVLAESFRETVASTAPWANASSLLLPASVLGACWRTPPGIPHDHDGQFSMPAQMPQPDAFPKAPAFTISSLWASASKIS